MSTQTVTDIAALVGEMEAPACESLGHPWQMHLHDQGGATHYGHLHCGACGIDVVKAYCATFSAWVAAGEGTAMCFSCHSTQELATHIWLLGPVNK